MPIIVLLVLVAVVLIIFRILAQLFSSGTSSTSYGHSVQYHEENDGFWFHRNRIPYGATVCYRCRMNGRIHQGSFVVDNDRQFVYTGGVSRDVEVLSVSSQQNITDQTYYDDSPIIQSQSISHHTTHSTPAQPSSFSGFPSAY